MVVVQWACLIMPQVPREELVDLEGLCFYTYKIFCWFFLPLAVFSVPSLLLILLYVAVTLNLINSGEVQLL